MLLVWIMCHICVSIYTHIHFTVENVLYLEKKKERYQLREQKCKSVFQKNNHIV